MNDFPVLDSPRDSEYDHGRVTLAEHGAIEPYVPETDNYCALPLRVTHSPTSGVTIELGPYNLDHQDIARLRDALRQYSIAQHGPTIRRIQ
jgi:hypothetical protein